MLGIPSSLLIFLICLPPCRSPDDIHEMMDDIAEENELAEEIGNIISQPIGFQTEFDDVCSHLNLGLARGQFSCSLI